MNTHPDRGIIAFYLLIIFLSSFIACSKTDNTTAANPDRKGLTAASARLIKPVDADDLEKRIKAELTRRYDRLYASYLYTWMAAGAGAAPGGTGTATAQTGGQAETIGNTVPDMHSDTNVQEQGVDEGDAVKTDGSFIYLGRGTHFFVLAANPAEQTAIISDIDLQEPIQELYLSGSRVIILTTPLATVSAGTAGTAMAVVSGSAVTRISIYDISTPSAPSLTASFDFPGYSQGTRRIADTIYLVTNYNIDLPSPVTCANYLPAGTAYDQQAFSTACEQARQENISRIESLSLDQLLPSYRETLYLNGTGSTLSAPLVTANDVYIPENGNGTDISIVVSLDLAASTPSVAASAVVSSWSRIYMSGNSLYLASTNAWLWIEPMAASGSVPENPEPKTAVHKFSVATGRPVYRGSGLVNGWINDRFSMSDYQGYLRVGTTRGGWWGESITNQLAILAEDASDTGSLVEVGKITGLAPGERIYSMRFDRTRGYMVTFRQTDPLFTFDLTDPAAPRTAGEIKVNGFATYIHLLGPETAPRLLTIGRSADSTGRVTGNKLQLFEVTDPAMPGLIGEYELGAGWSNALYDPHAFLYYEPLGILAVPYYSYNAIGAYTYSPGLDVFTVGTTGIALRGTIPAPVLTSGYGSYPDMVDRSVVIGDTVFSIACRSVTAARASDLGIIRTVTLPESYPYVTGGGSGEIGIEDVGTAGTGTVAGGTVVTAGN